MKDEPVTYLFAVPITQSCMYATKREKRNSQIATLGSYAATLSLRLQVGTRLY